MSGEDARAVDGGKGQSPFPPTRWSLVSEAADESPDSGRPALSHLLERYLPALRAHLVFKKGVPADEAEDILNEFISRKVLENDLLRQADHRKGRFRTFLLTALDRFLIDLSRRTDRRVTSCSVEADGTERAYAEVDPFDVEWARRVVGQALDRMSHRCDERTWQAFDRRILTPVLGKQPTTPYAQLVEELGFPSYAEATKAVSKAKQLYQRCLQEVIAEYAISADDTRKELYDLWEAIHGERSTAT